MPKGWANTTIGEIFTLQAGKNISSQEIHPNRSPNFQYPCYGGNGIRGYVSTANRNGDYPIIGRQGALCGNVNIASDFFYATEHAVVVQLYCNMNLKWAFYVLTALNLNQYATATAQPGLAVNVINDVPLLLPPIQEQERISREIDNYFSLLESFEKNIICLNSNVHQAKSLVLDLALSGKLTTSHTSHYGKNEWKSVRISDICTAINGLWTGKKEPFVKVGVIRNANFTKDFNLDYSKIALIDVEVSSFAKRSLMAGDLIVEKSGGSDKYPVGRAILYEGPDNEYSFSNFTMVLRPKEVNIINSKYLYYSLMNRYLKGAMRTMQTQTTGLHNLILDKFMSQTIALPPIEEQVHIVENISHYFSILDSISSSC